MRRVSHTRSQWPILVIFCIAALVRCFQLGDVPIELNRDEASLGYTAYSLLQTGREEHGVVWPVQIESFGDWKLPGYVYTLIPFIQLFGLTAWAVRLPSAIAGLSIVVGSYFLVRLLVHDTRLRRWMELGVPLMLAVSPWQVHFSHTAYEAHLALALFLWGLIALLVVVRDFVTHGRRRSTLLFVSLALWALTLLTYHSYQVFIPIFVVAIGWLYQTEWRRFFQKNILRLATILLPFMMVLALLLASGAQQANKTKFAALSIFNLNAYTKGVDEARMALPQLENPAFWLAINKSGAFVQQVQDNFLRLISPEFLFLRGGENHNHNITGFGNFFPIAFFGLVVGLGAVVIERQRWQVLLAVWILSAAVAPMITFEANHTTRFSPAFVALEILSAYGFFLLWQTVQKYFSKKVAIGILSAFALGLAYSVYHFLIYYYFVFPAVDKQYWPWQMKALVSFVETVKDQYDVVYFQDETYSPYVYFLFYEAVDPASVSERLEYYPVNAEGFHHVRRFDNVYFEPINWHDNSLYAGKKSLIIVGQEQIPEYNKQQSGARLLMTLENDWVPKDVEVWEYQGSSAGQ